MTIRFLAHPTKKAMFAGFAPALVNFAINESKSGSRNQTVSLPEGPGIINMESNEFERQHERYPANFKEACSCKADKNQNCCDNKQSTNPKENHVHPCALAKCPTRSGGGFVQPFRAAPLKRDDDGAAESKQSK